MRKSKPEIGPNDGVVTRIVLDSGKLVFVIDGNEISDLFDECWDFLVSFDSSIDFKLAVKNGTYYNDLAIALAGRWGSQVDNLTVAPFMARRWREHITALVDQAKKNSARTPK